jgi:hypothetical protein
VEEYFSMGNWTGIFRCPIGLFIAGFCIINAAAGEKSNPPKRFGITPDLKTYPQTTPKEALASIIKAIDAKKIDYLVAHLADPTFVDDRVKRVFGGRFDEQVEDTRGKMGPLAVKQLKRFQKNGTWKIDKTHAVLRLKDLEKPCVLLKKVGDRWFLENGNRLPKEED